MRDNRSALKKDSKINFSDGKTIWIEEEIGRGASCIVYDAAYLDNIGVWHRIRVKECYPAYLLIHRDENGNLLPSACNQDKFEAAKQNFICAYKRNAAIRNTLGLTNSTSNSTETVSCNDTFYIKMELNEGTDYGKFEDPSLKGLFTHIKSLAELIQKYHQHEYLYLDIKPENIFILPETDEHIILFDFDSLLTFEELEGGTEVDLSYSEGFSAPEQIQGRIDKIGKHTDIYSIGALVFYKLFNRTASFRECKISSTYCFEEMKYANERYQPKLYRTLDTFFKKTLSVAIPPRWHDMQQVIQQLDELIRLADINEVYLIDSFHYDSACFVGRNEEIRKMNEILSENQLFFLSGIGGIGKTELAKQYANKYREQYDTIIFSVFEKDIVTLVCDEILINKICRDEKESDQDYFKRKMDILKQIATPKTLIIIDNFDVDSDENLEILFRCPCKFIVTTRMDFRDYNYKQLNVDRIENLNDILDLFRTYNNKNYSETENEAVEKLIDYVDYHTMTVELIAKYLRNSEELPAYLYDKFLEREGTANTGEVNVKQRKDLRLRSESVNKHLSILFDVSAFDRIEKEIIGSLSLLAGIRIERSSFCALCAVENVESKLELFMKSGWVEYDPISEKISLHQVIQDLIYKNLSPDAESCPRIVEGMGKYISHDSINSTESEIRERVFTIFMERLSGNNIPYARLCVEYEKANRLDEAENICLGCHEPKSFDLLQKIYRKKIKLITTSSNDKLPGLENLPFCSTEDLVLIGELIDKVTYYCRKSSDEPDYLVQEYIEAGKEIHSRLDQNPRSHGSGEDPELNNIYSKITGMFDSATKLLPLTSYSALEKEIFYKEMQDFYKTKSFTFKNEYFSDPEQVRQYQELIEQLKEDTEKRTTEKSALNRKLKCIEIHDLSGNDLAKEYEKNGEYEKAIDCYEKAYEKGSQTYEITLHNIACVYFKTGNMSRGVACLEELIARHKEQGIYWCEGYMNLIQKLYEQKDFEKVVKYATELISYKEPDIPPNDHSSSVTYLISAYYFLYLLEQNQDTKKILWKNCLKYYGQLDNNRICEYIYDFILEYINKENITYDAIIKILCRIEGFSTILGSLRSGEDVRKKIIYQSIKKYTGRKDFEKYHVILLVKLAELSDDFPYENIKDAQKICDEAQEYYDKYGLKDKYTQSLIYKVKAEFMLHDKDYGPEKAMEVKKRCDFKLLAERQISDYDCDPEEQIAIWQNAATQYGFTDNYDMICVCLVQALEILRPILNQYEFSSFDDYYQEIMQDLIEVYIKKNDFDSAYLTIRELYERTVEYLEITGNTDEYEWDDDEETDDSDGADEYEWDDDVETDDSDGADECEWDDADSDGVDEYEWDDDVEADDSDGADECEWDDDVEADDSDGADEYKRDDDEEDEDSDGVDEYEWNDDEEDEDSDGTNEYKQDKMAEHTSDDEDESIWWLTEIADYFLEISKIDDAVRTCLAAIYFALAENPDTNKLKIGDEIGRDITLLCKTILELLDQETDVLDMDTDAERIDSLVGLKEGLLECKERSPMYADMYEPIITKISNKYQYREIEFKRE